MRLIGSSRHALIAMTFLAWAVAGCSSSAPPPAGPPGGTGGATDTGGSNPEGTGGTVAGGSGGVPTAPDAASVGTPDGGGGLADASVAPDVGSPGDGPVTPMGDDGGGTQPSYEGEIPIYYGQEVGPAVQMNCPEDPTQGWTEYQDSFHVERPYDVPVNKRFSISGGIYSFWVFPGDKPHSTDAQGRNPRTEATYGGTFDKATIPGGTGLYAKTGYFTTGSRMYSADMLIEADAVGSAIMQIHTTSAGGGPIGLRVEGGNMVNNGSLTVVNGSTVPGGLVNKWFNFKATLNADNTQVQIYVNNCLKSTYKGGRGDGHFYFKNGVYFCKKGPVCTSHYKNIHLYKK